MVTSRVKAGVGFAFMLAGLLMFAAPSPAVAGRGGHAGFKTMPMAAAPVPLANAPAATPAPDWFANIFDKIQGENDKVLTTQGKLADAQDRLANLIGMLAAVGFVLILLFIGILYAAWRTSRASAAAARALPVLERAYVFLSRQTTLTPPDTIGPSAAVRMRISVAFANLGRTPAVVRWVNLNHQYLSETPEGLYEDHARHGVGFVIGPGETQTFSDREVVIPRSEWDRAESGDGGLYLHGRIVYRDVFQVQHESYFCWRYDVAARNFTIVESETLNRYD